MWVPPSVFMSCFTICLPILWNPIWYPHICLHFLLCICAWIPSVKFKKSPVHVWRHLLRQQSRLWFSWPFPIYMSPTPVLLLSLLQQDDTHCGWSVSALASLEQDMHDVSEIECHARGFWMERGMKKGSDDRWSEINKKRAEHKSGMEGNRWIEGVRQKERQGWKGGIKWWAGVRGGG